MSEMQVHKSTIELELLEKLEPVLANLGFECRDVEVFTGGSGVIRIIVDREGGPDREHISIDDCAQVHQIVGPMFDVWDPLPTAYTLEVSSPGEKPALRMLKHFEEAVGEKIKFQTLEAVVLPSPSKPRKNWEGELLRVESVAGQLMLKDHSGIEHKIPVSQVKNAVWLRVWNP
ncbi:MAG: ribosome maturation factor RimP [Bdellovibrionota bacterium]